MRIPGKTYLPITLALFISGCGGPGETPSRGSAEPERAAQRAPRPDEPRVARRDRASGTLAPGPRGSAAPERTDAALAGRVGRVSERVLHAPNPLDRIDAMYELARSGAGRSEEKEAVVRVFENALQDRDGEVRRHAARVLTNYPIKVSMEKRRELAMSEPDMRVRAQLWLSIAEQWDVNEIRANLSYALQDPDPEIREWADKTLERLDRTPKGLAQRGRSKNAQED